MITENHLDHSLIQNLWRTVQKHCNFPCLSPSDGVLDVWMALLCETCVDSGKAQKIVWCRSYQTQLQLLQATAALLKALIVAAAWRWNVGIEIESVWLTGLWGPQCKSDAVCIETHQPSWWHRVDKKRKVWKLKDDYAHRLSQASCFGFDLLVPLTHTSNWVQFGWQVIMCLANGENWWQTFQTDEGFNGQALVTELIIC